MGDRQGVSAKAGRAAALTGPVSGFRASHAVRRVPFRARDGMELNL